MIDLDLARSRYEGLRERDRTIASMQSKRRMRPVFAHLLDDDARNDLDDELRAELAIVRGEARVLAAELGRRALLELGLDDLSRLQPSLRRLDAFLRDTPSEAIDVCLDLLTFLEDRLTLRAPPPDEDA